MLRAAADRGVKVHIIVYKEVTQALTCESSTRPVDVTYTDHRTFSGLGGIMPYKVAHLVLY